MGFLFVLFLLLLVICLVMVGYSIGRPQLSINGKRVLWFSALVLFILTLGSAFSL